MFLIGLATLVVSSVAVKVQRSVGEIQKANAEREIQLKQENARLQEKVEADRLAASVIPFLKCSDNLQRAAALQVIDPRHAQRFAATIAQKCTNLTVQARRQITEVEQQSDSRQHEKEFFGRLANAREFKSSGLDGPAARLFDEASQFIPDSYASRVNKDELTKAKKAFSEGQFSEAADRFVIAFAAFSNSE